MKIRLQNFDTGLFLDLAGGWTANPQSAREFSSLVHAAEFQFEARLAHTYVVVAPDSRQTDTGFTRASISGRIANVSNRAKDRSRSIASKMAKPFRDGLREVAASTAHGSREAAQLPQLSLMAARRRIALAMES